MAEEFPTYRTRVDLEKLLADGAVENTRLELKDSRALARKRSRLPTYASMSRLWPIPLVVRSSTASMRQKRPAVQFGLDDGVIDKAITREWIGQILNSRLQPRTSEYCIDEIDLGDAKRGFAISVQQSQTGPHQATDKRITRGSSLRCGPWRTTRCAILCAGRALLTCT
jgi:hypothetical protein